MVCLDMDFAFIYPAWDSLEFPHLKMCVFQETANAYEDEEKGEPSILLLGM